MHDKVKKDVVSKMYVYNGDKKTFEIELPNIDDKYIQDATASKVLGNSYIISGTYSKSKKSDKSIGLYIFKTTNNEISFTKYINYLDIKNFTSYLKERVQEKIEKKKEKKESKGEELELKYLIAAHDIIEYDDTYILVGEAFYPTYRRECSTSTSNGVTSTTCYYVFDGYQYTHYFVYAFDKNGNQLWSNSKEMNISDKPFTVKKFLDLRFENNTLSILYGTGKTYNYEAYDKNGNVTKSKTYNPIETEDADDKIKRSSMNTVYWYDNYFIAYGWQKIKNKEENEKRKVYYLNKLNFVP